MVLIKYKLYYNYNYNYIIIYLIIIGTDEGFEGACKQRGFQMIRPDNDWFPGLDDLREDFYSHEWIFKKTPKFKVSFFLRVMMLGRVVPEIRVPEIRVLRKLHGVNELKAMIFPKKKFRVLLCCTMNIFGPKSGHLKIIVKITCFSSFSTNICYIGMIFF